ncbi:MULTISPECIES: hypothetical protein [Burkholderia]|nr:MULTISPECIES: hypothetical protein [Burkholderia]MBJ9681521.1 hypothetical protein [Burkholderia multivorans]MBU9209741.1 hypothetical protein [Burkholderia multivorans]MBU9371788.1 hypothetical protein [Burkholderia multivorans]MBU9669867.1 hypothetical protein [Burkholderia multivorans]MBY4795643.1 hypothetical protein [Burkholderia multivorans]
MEKSPVKPKALESRFGVGGSTRSLLAASEQDFGGTKQNLRGSRRFGPIFMSKGRIAVPRWRSDAERAVASPLLSLAQARTTKGWFCL